MVSPNEDYYAWTQETIEKLRQGRLSEVNMEDLIEELEDIGRIVLPKRLGLPSLFEEPVARLIAPLQRRTQSTFLL